MDARQLRRVFEALLRTSLASPLLLAGCGPDLTGYTSPAIEGGVPAVSGLSPSVIPDVIQLRSRADFGPENVIHTVRSSFGEACATAQDQQACATELEGLAPGPGFHRDCLDFCESFYLATTHGDKVEALTSIDAVRAFLGQIDTPQEAALLAFAHGYNFSSTEVGRGGVRPREDGGFDVIGFTGYACGAGTAITRHVLKVTPSGEVDQQSSDVVERGSPNCIVGRRPAGLEQGRVARRLTTPLGRHFAQTAQLEAAAVNAFLRMRDELKLHGAPVTLQRDALVSAVEEVGHARINRQFAEQHGADPVAPRVAPLPLRPLFAVALDNRIEGCVRETYGALVAHHQSVHARDPWVRRVMRRIAAEETHHAALSWSVDRWAQSRLGRADRARLEDAAEHALERLREEASSPVHPEVIAKAGLPTPEQAVALLEDLGRAVAAEA